MAQDIICATHQSIRRMQLYFNYFWFICAAVMLINVAIFRRRFTTIVSHGVLTKAEADHFIVWLAVWFVGGPLLAGVIALVAGWPSPLCAGILQFDSAPKALFAALSLAGWAALLWWVWRGGGADFLARAGPALSRPPVYDRKYSPSVVRAVVTAFVLFFAIGGAIAFRTVQGSPLPPCPTHAITS
jgi:hypothetical protein